MINFENAIRTDKIAQMSIAELQEIKDLLTPQESKDALTACKEAIDKDENLFCMPIHILLDAIEIKMNSVGYYHYAVDGTCYDLYQIAEQLIENYSYDAVKKQIAETIYEIDFYCLYDDVDE